MVFQILKFVTYYNFILIRNNKKLTYFLYYHRNTTRNQRLPCWGFILFLLRITDIAKHRVVQLHRRQQFYKKCTSILDINFLILLLRNAPYRAITVYMKNLLCSILAYLEFPHHRAISILVYHFCLPKPQNVLNKKVEILIKQVVI